MPDLRQDSTEGSAAEALFLKHQAILEEVIAVVCRRNRLRPDEAEEFDSVVRCGMVSDGYTAFSRFEGRSSLRTYLAVVVERLYLDHRNHQWGRWRPSAEARRIGPLGLELDRLLNRDGLAISEATPILLGRFGTSVSADQIADLAARLPARVPRRKLDAGPAVLEAVAEESTPEREVLEHEADRRRSELLKCLAAAMQGLESEDKAVLALRMQGAQIATIARRLHLPERPLYRRLEGILRHLRVSLERQGVNAEAVRETLGPLDEGPRGTLHVAKLHRVPSIHRGEE